MKIIVFSVLIVATIGLLIPGALAAYPDPDKDPKEYLIRYYTEPKYKEWFDSQFPNTTIEKKVNYPNKIITENYYVSPFGFVIEPPKGWEIEISPESLPDEDGNVDAGLVSFFHPREIDCNEEYDAGVIMWFEDGRSGEYQQYGWKTWDDIERYNEGGLLFWFSNMMVWPEQSQLKVTNESLSKTHNGDYVVRYDFTDVSILPEQVNDDGEICGELRVTMKNTMVLFLMPDQELYQIIYASEPHYYDSDIGEVNKMLKTFHVGKTELLSDIMKISEPQPEPQSEPIPPEPPARKPPIVALLQVLGSKRN